MNRAERLHLLAHARELEELGVPMDLDLMPEDDLVALPPKLLITAEEPGLTNTVFSLRNGLVGYILDVTILNHLPEPLWISGFELELPWEDGSFLWLPDPADVVPPQAHYRFPGAPDLVFPREEVINPASEKRGNWPAGIF